MYQKNNKTKKVFHQHGTNLRVLGAGNPQGPKYDKHANGVVGLLHGASILNTQCSPTPTLKKPRDETS